MNASRAKRRWMAWCRYVAATDTQANRRRQVIHNGQAKAYSGHMYAGRSHPHGVRVPYYPRWAAVRRG